MLELLEEVLLGAGALEEVLEDTWADEPPYCAEAREMTERRRVGLPKKSIATLEDE